MSPSQQLLQSLLPEDDILDGLLCHLHASVPTQDFHREPHHNTIDCNSCLVAITVPSFSLTSPGADNNNYYPDEHTTKALSRDEIRSKTAQSLSYPVRVSKGKGDSDDDDHDDGEVLQQLAATKMLNGCIESMDQLVDARLSAYSKILRQHYGTKTNKTGGGHENESSSSTDNAAISAVVDFKLRTMLELGTNISFDSFALNVKTKTATKKQTQNNEIVDESTSSAATGATVGRKDILLEIVMNGLAIGGKQQPKQQLIRLEVPGVVYVEADGENNGKF
jgi:hypothetical protein